MDIYEAGQAPISEGQRLLAFERAIRTHAGDKDLREARAELRAFLWAQIEGGGDGSIAEAIEQLEKSGRPLPQVATVLVRSLAVNGLLPKGGDAVKLDRELVSVIELGLPRLSEFVHVNQKAQTFEKFPRLRSAHHRVCEILAPLKADYRTLEGLVSARQPITGALNHSCVRTYGETFCLGSIRGIIDSVLHAAQEVTHSKSTFLLDVDFCNRLIQDVLARQ